MGKKKIIAFVILILVIIILSIVGILIYNNKQNDNIVVGENNINQIAENLEENSIEDSKFNEVDSQNTIEENKTVEEPAIIENKEETNKVIQEKSTQKTTKKESSKSAESTTKKETTSGKTSSQIQEKEQSTKSEETKNNDSSYKEQEVQIVPTTECVGNNHKIGAGNTGKWFETQEQAAAYFKTEIAKWGKLWENYEIEDEEYYKNCPYGYEVWTCPQCGKWTINFYYNK